MGLTRKPNLVLEVQNVSNATRFYNETLGWQVCAIHQTGAIVELRCHDASTVLLTIPAKDFTPYVDVAYSKPQPGQRFYITGHKLEEQRSHLLQQGHFIPELLVNPGFGQTLLLTDPDGYIAALWEELAMDDASIVLLYQDGPTMLEQALAGLPEASLDLRRAPDKWSIRETVLHLIDSDVTTAHRLKFALAEPGRTYMPNPYDPDVWANNTLYHERPVDTEITLFRCTRGHILHLVQSVPDALKCTVVTPTGEVSVRTMIKMVAGHARSHIRQILETRSIYGV